MHPALPEAHLIACHECDLLQRRAALPPGTRAHCPRCGTVLYRHRRDSLDRTLAWTLASTALFVVANTLPFMSFEMGGRVQQNVIFSGVQELLAQDYLPLAALVFLASMLAPALKIAGLLYVLLPLKFGRRPLQIVPTYKLIRWLGPWSMMEVYMLGVIVAIIKLSSMAEIVLGTAFFAFSALIITTTAASSTFDSALIWGEADLES